MEPRDESDQSSRVSDEIRRVGRLHQQIDQLYQQGQYADAIALAVKTCHFANSVLGNPLAYFESLQLLAWLYASMDVNTEAERVYQEALAIGCLIKGGVHPAQATVLHNLGLLAYRHGDTPQAITYFEEALAMRRSALGEDHLDYAENLYYLGGLYAAAQHDYAKAEPYLLRALAIQRALLENDAPEIDISLDNLGGLYYEMGDYEKAEQFYQEVLEGRRRTLDKDHPRFKKSLNDLIAIHKLRGNYSAAALLMQEVLDIERQQGEEPVKLASRLDELVEMYRHMGKYAEASRFCLEALELRRSSYGSRDVRIAKDLNALATLHELNGSYAEAELLFRQALNLVRTVFGEEHTDVLSIMNNLAKICFSRGNYIEAEQLYKQILVVKRKTLGENHAGLAINLNNLAALHYVLGSYSEAVSLTEQALAILRNTWGEQHMNLAPSLNNLAALYDITGSYDKAVLCYEQALEIRRKALGEQHPDVAQSMHNLATHHRALGNYTEAESLYRQALQITRDVLGEKHPDVANFLYNLAAIHMDNGDYTEALELDHSALEIRRENLGEEHPLYAQSLNTLAALYKRLGNYIEAESLFQRSIQIIQTALGKEHDAVTEPQNNLALLYFETGNYAKAEALLQESLMIRRKALGEKHPTVALSLSNLATLYFAIGRAPEAMGMMKQVAVIEDQIVGQVSSISSESQRTAYFATLQTNFYLYLSLARQPRIASPQAALELVLRRKALGAEVLAAQRDATLGGRYPHLQEKVRALTLLREQVAQRTIQGPGPEGFETHQQQLAVLNGRRERLEAELVRQIPEMNLEQRLRVADRHAVAEALPKDSALVEFIYAAIFNGKMMSDRNELIAVPHYLAFVLPAGEPDSVQMLDLGEAEAVDTTIAAFRATITNDTEAWTTYELTGQTPPASPAKQDIGRHASPATNRWNEEAFLREGKALCAMVFDPLLTSLAGRTRLFLTPDGDLSRLPFESLPTADNRHIIDDYHISYLSVGRDVLRLGIPSISQPAPSLVVADPAFDLGCGDTAASIRERPHGRRSRDLERGRLHFGHLPGTRAEGEQIATQLGVQPLLERYAVEAAIKTCRSPRILHIATHGFFLPDQKHNHDHERFWQSTVSRGEFDSVHRLAHGLENPLLRSGLALAGANTWLKGGTPPSEAEDGLLTAEDVAGLDLYATELVVLSACETGLGDVQVGEGVFGLRRSFVLAGAKTMIMSLWKVPDQQTQELMIGFYQRVLQGQARADALREAQLAMKAKHPHPYYWGAFICQGDPGPLSSLKEETGP